MPLTVRPPALPSQSIPFIGPDGKISSEWYRYLLDLTRYQETLRAAIP
jgi:hypothetical protein